MCEYATAPTPRRDSIHRRNASANLIVRVLQYYYTVAAAAAAAATVPLLPTHARGHIVLVLDMYATTYNMRVPIRPLPRLYYNSIVIKRFNLVAIVSVFTAFYHHYFIVAISPI